MTSFTRSTEIDFLMLRIALSSGIETISHQDAVVSVYYVVRNPENHSYVRMSPALFALLSKFDGQSSLGDVLRSAHDTDGVPPFQTVCDFVVLLYRNGMISVQSEEAACFLRRRINDGRKGHSSPSEATEKATHWKVSFGHVDGLVTALYQHIGKACFTKTAVLVMVLISLSGTALFSVSMHHDIEHVFLALQRINLQSATIVGLVVGIPLSVVAHELAHALTCKHFGRKVTAMGVILRCGCPEFFTDVSESWMLPKNKRLAVDAAGVVANLLLGAVCAILANWPSSEPLHEACTIGAAANFLAVIANLIPVLKLDGYYVLSDWLDQPRLREVAIKTLLSGCSWRRMLTRRVCKTEAILLTYGLACLIVGLAVLVLLASVAFSLVGRVTPEPRGIALSALATGLLAPTVIGYASNYVRGTRIVEAYELAVAATAIDEQDKGGECDVIHHDCAKGGDA